MAQDDDGRVLAEASRGGSPFGFVSMEVWPQTAGVSELERYVIQEESVKLAGHVGYPGRSGLYVPQSLVQAYQQAQIYYTYNASGPENTAFFEHVSANAEQVDCNAGAACVSSALPGSTCSTWCPEFSPYARDRGLRPIPLLHIRGYDVGVVEAVVRNNDFHAAMELMTDAEQAAAVQRLYGTPIMFYHWEPSLLTAPLQLRRIFLPAGPCTTKVAEMNCDWLTENLLKVTSSNVRNDAPLAWKLLQAFGMPDDPSSETATLEGAGIKTLIRAISVMMAADPNANVDALAEDLACRWVQANQHRGGKWSRWASRDIRDYADIITWERLTFQVLSMVLVFLVVVFLWEQCFLGSSLFGFVPGAAKALGDRLRRSCRACLPCRRGRRGGSGQDAGQGGSAVAPRTSVDRRDTMDAGIAACVVHFASSEWVVSEHKEVVEVVIYRTGRLDQEVVLSWRTKGGDAVPGVNYVAASGTLTLEPYDRYACIRLRILCSPHFESGGTSFHVELLGVMSGDAELGAMTSVLVHITNQCSFPCAGLPPDTPAPKLLRHWLWILYRQHCWKLGEWKGVCCKGDT